MSPTNTQPTAEQYKGYFEEAVPYDEYKRRFAAELALGDESPYAAYLPQNWRRQSRLDRKLKLTDELEAAVSDMPSRQHWLVITEHWCGDASQINPVIAKAAEASPDMIKLRFIYRDEHEELIDAHLTDGRSKSIPILIVLDEEFNLAGSYGPRPAAAQKLVKSILAAGEPYSIPLHSWYAKDKQLSIQQDLAQLLHPI